MLAAELPYNVKDSNDLAAMNSRQKKINASIVSQNVAVVDNAMQIQK